MTVKKKKQRKTYLQTGNLAKIREKIRQAKSRISKILASKRNKSKAEKLHQIETEKLKAFEIKKLNLGAEMLAIYEKKQQKYLEDLQKRTVEFLKKHDKE
jgi:hypothetical protein